MTQKLIEELSEATEKLLSEFKHRDPSPAEVVAIQVVCEHLVTLPGVLPPET